VNVAAWLTAWAGAAVGASRFGVLAEPAPTLLAGVLLPFCGLPLLLGGELLTVVPLVLELPPGGEPLEVGVVEVVGVVDGGVVVVDGVEPQCLLSPCTPPCPRSHGVSGS
jgi:hypothetical protein